jgi:hypothetical protein
MKTERMKTSSALKTVLTATTLLCASLTGIAEAQFNPFAVGAELTKRNGRALPKTEQLCCMIDPVGENYIQYHGSEDSLPLTELRDAKSLYKQILKNRIPSARSLRLQASSQRRRGGRGNIQRRLRAFRAVGRQCLNGAGNFNDRSLFQCDQFAAMNGAQAKLENSNGTLSVIFQDPIRSFRGINIFSGSKNDINRQLLTSLNDPNLSLPTTHLTFNLDQATLAMLQDVVDFNIAVLTGTQTFQGDFTELPNGCDDDGAGATSGGGDNTEANIPDEGYLATTLTNSLNGNRASCAFEYSNTPLAGSPTRLVSNGTYGRILCDFGSAVQVQSISLYVPPAQNGNFGIVIDIASFFGGSTSPNWIYDMDGGAVSTAAENAVRALYGLDVEGVTPKNFEPLEITITTNTGTYTGKYNLPV